MTAPPWMTRRALRWVALVIVIAVAGANGRVLFGGTWDDVRYHAEIAPPRLAAATAVQGGQLPAWWEGSGLGVPLAGEPSHGALYPPTWIAGSPRALDWLAIVHLMWAAIGVAVWARRRSDQPPRYRSWIGGASEPAAIAVALLVATSGLVTSTALRGALPVLAHLPWIGACACWLAEAETRAIRARAAACLGVLLGMVGLAGNLGGFGDAVLIAAIVIVRPRRPAATDDKAHEKLPYTPYVLAAVCGGLAIAAAQWLPALQHLGTPHAGDSVSGLPLARLIELVVPTASGSPDPERAIAMLGGDHAWAPSLFVGAPLLALAAVRVPSRRILALCGVLAVLALVAGRGGWPAWLGAPELHLAALAIVLGAHAGSGLDALIAGERRAILALAAGISCTLIGLIALAVQRSRHPEIADALEPALINGGLGVAAGLGAFALVWRGPPGALPAVFALLVIPSFGAHPSIAPVTSRAVVEVAPPWVDAIAGTTSDGAPRRVYRPPSLIDLLSPPRADVMTPTSKPAAEPAQRESLADAIETFSGASSWRWGIAVARSDDPARLAIHDGAWQASASGGGRLLDRFGIGFAVVPELLVTPRGFTALARRGRWALIEYPAAPPASVMRSWLRAVDPGDAFSLLFPYEDSLSLPRGAVVLGEPGDAQPPKPKDAPLPCTIDDWTAGNIELQCTSDLRGYAVVSSSAAPGWSVTVDGAEAAWVPADVLRRAVAIPAGDHRVHWSFAAPGLGVGLVIAGIGLALLIALALASRR